MTAAHDPDPESTMSRVGVAISETTWMDFRAVVAFVANHDGSGERAAWTGAQALLAHLDGLPYFRLNALTRAAAAGKLA